MAYAMIFPRELKHNFFRDLDYTFAFIWLLTFLLIGSPVAYLQSLPVRQLTDEQVKHFTQAIYRVRIDRQPNKDAAETNIQRLNARDTDVIPLDEEPSPVNKKLSIEDKRREFNQKREARLAEMEASRRAIDERFKSLVGPTSVGNGGQRSGASAQAMVGLESGGFSDVDLKNGVMAVLTEAAQINRLKSIKGNGSISEEISDISLEDINAWLKQPGSLEEMLATATLKMPTGGITTKSKSTKSASRNQEAISQVILANKNQVQYCYWTFKRRDATLEGQVVVQITISPAGEVTRIYFKRSDWNHNPLQREIEHCIRNIIAQWRFEPIGADEGDVTASATFIFN